MAEYNLADCRILVVEDEFMLADHLQDLLEEAGAVVLGPVANIENALKVLAAETSVDGVVLDINLGGDPSYPVAAELLRRDIPFLFTSGYDLDAIPSHYRHIPRHQKPVSASTLRDAVARLVQT